MQWVHLEKSRLGGAYLHRARLWDAQLNGSRLWGAHLEGADFTRAVLTESQLEAVDLRGVFGINDWEQVQAAFYDERTRFPVNVEEHRTERVHPSPPGYGD